MNNTPVISIIVPVYNRERTLRRCVDSIIAQTFTDWECLLIDDGSTDSSLSICKQYSEKDFRVRVFCQKNGGPSKARNTGIAASNGGYIMFADSDDALHPAAMNTISNYLQQTKVDILKFGYKRLCGNRIEVVSLPNTEYISEQWKMLDRTEGTQYCGFVWNSVFSRSCIGDIRFREEFRWCEDHLFSFECFKKAECMLLIPETLYYYTVDNNSESLSCVSNPLAVFDLAQAELPIKLNLVTKDHFQTWKGVWAEYYGKLNYAVKVFFDGKPSYKDAAQFKKRTISVLNGKSFPATCKYGRVFYMWPFAIAYVLLCLKVNYK